VTARVPVRTNRDDRYFTDKYQAMPLLGYTAMFWNMLRHPNIKVLLGCDYREVIHIVPWRQMIFTGPVDVFYNHRFGRLPYRSLEFVHQTLPQENFQAVGTVNYPNEYAYTRITEFKHLTGQQHPHTSVVYEYPRAEGDPYYPIPAKEPKALYKKYQELTEAEERVKFVGRLATYQYYNMDQIVAQALHTFEQIQKEEEAKGVLVT
jgi:UDP-galactopyranose mutase